MELAWMDDEINAAMDKQGFGAADRLFDRTDTVRNTILSAYPGLRRTIRHADLVVVEGPHGLKDWQPNRTITALFVASDRKLEKASAISRSGYFQLLPAVSGLLCPDREILT
jgi:hypothetical protein